jgi:hypothetical protein
MARETLAQATARANKAEKDLAQLKADVVAKVNDLTEEHGWCDAAKRALTELGLVTNEPVTVKVTIRDPQALKDHFGYLGYDGALEDAVIEAIDYADGDAIDVEVVKADAR